MKESSFRFRHNKSVKFSLDKSFTMVNISIVSPTFPLGLGEYRVIINCRVYLGVTSLYPTLHFIRTGILARTNDTKEHEFKNH